LTDSHIAFVVLKGSDLHIHDHVTTLKHYKTNTYYLHYTYIQFELPAIMTTHSQQGHGIGFYTLKYTV